MHGLLRRAGAYMHMGRACCADRECPPFQLAFCESAAPNNSGDEVLYLPPIVESAESSPQAAAECAHLIRKYLKKDYWSKPTCQYNALMLMRILADNPGPTFTRNVDQKFVDTVKELLRAHRSQQVDQMLFETLSVFEATKSYDEGLLPLIEMWKKEKEKAQKSQVSLADSSLTRSPSTVRLLTQLLPATTHAAAATAASTANDARPAIRSEPPFTKLLCAEPQ